MIQVHPYAVLVFLLISLRNRYVLLSKDLMKLTRYITSYISLRSVYGMACCAFSIHH